MRALSNSSVCKPSSSGMRMSSSTRSTFTLSRISNALRPSSASSTVWPWRSSRRLGLRDCFVQRTNGSHDAGEVRRGAEVGFSGSGNQRLQKLNTVQKIEHRFGRILDLLQIGHERGVLFAVGILLAQLAIADDEIQEGAAVALQRFQLQLARFDARLRKVVVNQHEELAAGGVNFLQVRDIRVQPEILRLLLQHLAVANDLVQRRAQTVANVGKSGVVTGIGLLRARSGTTRGSAGRDVFSYFGFFAGHDAPLLCNRASILASNFARSTGLVS